MLAYRSYRLAERTELGLQTFAAEYLHYTAEITAQRLDAEVSSRMFRAADQWQLVERRIDTPDTASLAAWIDDNPWIESAIYVPDDDVLGTIYVSEASPQSDLILTHEFYTASGQVRYSYDPRVLLDQVGSVIKTVDQHMLGSVETAEVRRKSRIEVVEMKDQSPPEADGDLPSMTIPLSAPLERFSVRASIEGSYIGAGWENHRVVSLWLSVIAMILVIIAALMTGHGLQREAEAVHLRSALIANVSHELRTPLSMIRLGAETIKRNPGLDETSRHEIAESIHREAMHLHHLVENVLDVARWDRSGVKLVKGAVDPADLVESLVADYRPWLESKGFAVELEINPDIAPQPWDREALSRALLNLIDNAVKYSDEEKHISISLGQTTDTVEIAVRDRGLGLPAEDIKKIFDPYYRAQFSDTQTRRGAGLGLTLVAQIVRAHGGTIEVDSNLGRGSTFRLRLPRPVDVRGMMKGPFGPKESELSPESGEPK